jgi:hypothetical protein
MKGGTPDVLQAPITLDSFPDAEPKRGRAATAWALLLETEPVKGDLGNTPIDISENP